MKRSFTALGSVILLILGFAQAPLSEASPCTAMNTLRLQLSKSKLSAATQLRLQVEGEYNKKVAVATEKANLAKAQQTKVNDLAQQNDSLKSEVSMREDALKEVLRAIKKRKAKKKSLNRNLKRQRSEMNQMLIDAQQSAYQSGNILFSEQLSLMTFNSEAYFSQVEVDAQAKLLVEAQEQEQHFVEEVAAIEKDLAACPAE